MCVAIVIESAATISAEDLRAMAHVNDDGAGIAWIEGDSVRYVKGLSVKAVIKILPNIPRPALLHFRYATQGRPSASLCHPFPLGVEALSRRTAGSAPSVLIHNGTWSDWRDYAPDPRADVSDTQIAAYVAGFYPQILDEVRWATAVMTAAGEGRADIVMRGEWSEYGGNMYSNLGWQAYRAIATRAPHEQARFADWKRGRQIGSVTDKGKTTPVYASARPLVAAPREIARIANGGGKSSAEYGETFETWSAECDRRDLAAAGAAREPTIGDVLRGKLDAAQGVKVRRGAVRGVKAGKVASDLACRESTRTALLSPDLVTEDFATVNAAIEAQDRAEIEA